MNQANKIKEMYQTFFGLYQKKPVSIFQIGTSIELTNHTDHAASKTASLSGISSTSMFGCIAPNDLSVMRIFSKNFSTGTTPTILEFPDQKPNSQEWYRYFLCLTWTLKQMGVDIQGFDWYDQSEIPIGGFGSSAALLVGLGQCLNDCFGLRLNTQQLIDVLHRAENIIVPCGQLDYISLLSNTLISGNLTIHDHKINTTTYVELPPDTIFIKAYDPHFQRLNLAQTAYPTIVKECKKGLQLIEKKFGANSYQNISSIDHHFINDSVDPDMRYVKYQIQELELVEALENTSNIQNINLTRYGWNGIHLLEINAGVPPIYPTLEFMSKNDINGRETGGGGSVVFAIITNTKKVKNIMKKLNTFYQKTFNREMRFIIIKPGIGVRTIKSRRSKLSRKHELLNLVKKNELSSPMLIKSCSEFDIYDLLHIINNDPKNSYAITQKRDKTWQLWAEKPTT